MGEETKIEKMFLTCDDGYKIVLDGIKDIQFTECVEHDYYDDTVVVPELTVTFEAKYPKFFRCKNRKRYKKLMMSLGYSRDLVEVYFQLYSFLRQEIKEYNPSYQELWNEIRINTLGF